MTAISELRKDYPRLEVAHPDPLSYNIFETGAKGALHFVPRNVIDYLQACGIVYDGPTPRMFDGRIHQVLDDKPYKRVIQNAVDAYGAKHLVSKGELLNITEMAEAMLDFDVLPGFPDPEDEEPYSTLIYGKPAGGLFAFENGILNTAGNILLPFTPHILVPSCYHARYDPDIETCPAEDIIEGILPDEDTRRFFYEMVGYFLFGDMNPPAIFVIYGPGETGKSALAHAIKALMGKEMVSGLSLRQITQRFMPAMLEGKRLNISGETGEGKTKYDSVDGELMKQLSDGDDILVERKGGHPYYIHNTAKLLFLTNTLPDFGDTSSGLFRRLFTIPCRVPQDPTAKIYDELVKPECLSWLVNKALDAYTDFLDRGSVFVPSEEMKKEWTNARAQDPFYDFFYDTTEATSLFGICEAIMTSPDLRFANILFDRYRSYCYSTGAHPLGSRKFYEKVRNEMPIEVGKSPTTVTVDGVRKSVRVFVWKKERLDNEMETGTWGRT